MRRARFGNHSGGGVSFFAFQDIITATVGFLIVLTLFLALNVTEVIPQLHGGEAAPLAKREEELRSMQAKVIEMKQEVADLQTRPADDETTLKRMIGQLKTTVAELQQPPRPGLDRDHDATAMDRELTLEKQKLLTSLEKIHASIQEADKLAAGTVKELPDLVKKVKDAETSLQRGRDGRNVLILVPERNDTRKEPVLVLVQNSRIQIQRADDAPTSVYSIPEFVEQLRRLSAATHYVVLYFKPSGSNHFEALTTRARQEGFEIGYDVVPEDIELEFRNTSPAPKS